MKTNNLKILKLKECRKPQISTFLLWLCWIAFCIFILVKIVNKITRKKEEKVEENKKEKAPMAKKTKIYLSILGVFLTINKFPSLPSFI